MPIPFSFTPSVDGKAIDAGTYTASAAAQVGGSDKIFTFGAVSPLSSPVPAADDPVWEGKLHLQWTAIDIVGNDESYTFLWQLSMSSTFASGIFTQSMAELGALEVLNGDTDTPPTGRLVLPITNWHNQVVYDYGRLFIVHVGATSSITLLDGYVAGP